jgi:hypothetical protein
MEININVRLLPRIVRQGPAIKLPTKDASGGMLPVDGKYATCYYHRHHLKTLGSCRCPNLLIHETSDSVRGTALESNNDGIPGLDHARTIPIIMKDSEAAAAAPI